MSIRVVLAAIVGCVIVADVHGQQPVFRTRTDLVQVDAVVVDAQGKPIRGLTKSDFVLVDRGTPQIIDAFEEVSHESTASPLFPSTQRKDVADNAAAASTRLVVIGLDDLHMQGKSEYVKEMARQLVERIGPEASLALVTSSGEFGVEPTDDRSLLLNELDAFLDRYDPEGRRLANGRLAVHGSLMGSSTEVEHSAPADAARFFGDMRHLRTIDDVAKRIGTDNFRRKAMVWISGGVPGPTFEECKNTVKGAGNYYCMAAAGVMDQLRRSNVVTYAVHTGDFPSRSLQEMTEGSGGFTINMAQFDRDIDRIVDDLDHYYLLGFYPSKRDGRGYRALEVRVNRPGATVRFRRGYQPGAAPEPPRNVDTLSRLSAGVLPQTDLPLRLSAAPVPGTRRGKTDVILTLEVRSDDGPRLAAGASVSEVLKYSVWAVDLKKKKPVAQVGREARVTFSPAEQDDERALEVKYQVQTRLSLSPGHYQLRASASSVQLKRLGSVYFDVDVPDFTAVPISLGGIQIGYADGPRIFGLDSPLVKGMMPFEPTLDREFTTADTLRVFTHVGGVAADSCVPNVSLAQPGGVAVRSATDIRRAHEQTFDTLDATVSLADMVPGSYVLTVDCGPSGADPREVGIVIRPAALPAGNVPHLSPLTPS